jgi:hypothetical protein
MGVLNAEQARLGAVNVGFAVCSVQVIQRHVSVMGRHGV